MGAVAHRYLTALAGFLAGLGGLLATPGFEPLGIPPEAGVGLAFASAVIGLGATWLRTATDPRPA